MFKGTLNGDLFIGYIEQYLAPTLKKSDILVLDSCSAHKKYELDSVFEQGASVLFLLEEHRCTDTLVLIGNNN